MGQKDHIMVQKGLQMHEKGKKWSFWTQKKAKRKIFSGQNPLKRK